MTPGRQAPASSSGGCHLGLGRLASAALLPLLLLLLLGRLLGCRRCHCLLLLHHLGWGEAVDVVDHIPPDLGLQAPGRGWHRGWGVIEGSGVGGTAGWFAFGRWHRVCVLSWGPGCVGRWHRGGGEGAVHGALVVLGPGGWAVGCRRAAQSAWMAAMRGM